MKRYINMAWAVIYTSGPRILNKYCKWNETPTDNFLETQCPLKFRARPPDNWPRAGRRIQLRHLLNMILTIFYPFLSITRIIYLRLTENLVSGIIYRVLEPLTRRLLVDSSRGLGVWTIKKWDISGVGILETAFSRLARQLNVQGGVKMFIAYHCGISSLTAGAGSGLAKWGWWPARICREASRLSMLKAAGRGLDEGERLCSRVSEAAASSGSSSPSLSSPTTSISCSRMGSLLPPLPPFLAASHSCRSCAISTMIPFASSFFCCFSSCNTNKRYLHLPRQSSYIV